MVGGFSEVNAIQLACAFFDFLGQNSWKVGSCVCGRIVTAPRFNGR
jgi:hypothetical protein